MADDQSTCERPVGTASAASSGSGDSTAGPQPLFPSATTALLLCVSGWVLLTGFLFWAPYDLDRRDQARQALCVLDVFQTGSFLLPRETETYSTKPPLYTWVSWVFARAEGAVTEDNVRYASALALLAVTLIVFRLGSGLGGPRLGIGAAFCLLANWHTGALGAAARTDMMLCAFLMGALVCYARAVAGGIARRRGWLWAMWICMGLGMLAKGPVALVLPLLAFTVDLGVRRRWRDWRGLMWWPGLPAAVGIFLLWFVPASLCGGRDFLQATAGRELVDRLTGAGSKARLLGAPTYYLPREAYYLLPWTLVSATALFDAWRARRMPTLVAWAAVTLAFFSLIPAGKRIDYVYPMVPALSVLTAAHVLGLGRGARTALLLSGVILVVLGAAAAVGGLAPEALANGLGALAKPLARLQYRHLDAVRESLIVWRWALCASGVMMLAGGAVALNGGRRGRGGTALAGMVLAGIAFVVLSQTVASPAGFYGTVAARMRFCREVQDARPAGCRIVVSDGVPRSVCFTLGINSQQVHAEDLDKHGPGQVGGPPRPMLLIVTEREWEGVAGRTRDRFSLLVRSLPLGAEPKRRVLLALLEERPPAVLIPKPAHSARDGNPVE